MKKILLTASAIVMSFMGVVAHADSGDENTRRLTVFDKVVFYDGYNETVFDADEDDGILRHRNSLYAVKLTDEQLDWAGEDLKMYITIGALCDNYDRIGNINVALVRKGNETYDPFKVQRLELGRFVTPFMDKNYKPTEVPYEFDIPYVSNIFHDLRLREGYDLWLEFELFGIPYAANKQISGCADRNDVFEGTLVFETTTPPIENTRKHELVPIVMKKPEYKGNNLNNYNENATDELGKCIKKYTFTVPNDVKDSQIVLVMSNHGANAGGEEYERRLHLLTFDDKEYTSFTPGGVSCEPYRQYNTQPNGIYGFRYNDAKEQQWLNHSNWCPGAAIPIRVLPLGELKAGEHSLTINVPDAEFVDGQGDFPVSMYFQGMADRDLPSGIEGVTITSPEVDVTLDDNILRFTSEMEVVEISVFSMDGKLIYGKVYPGNELSLERFESGAYLVNFMTEDSRCAVKKIMVK